jgi:LuxR family quorum sensing-dependent transcriptional regulator
VPWCRARKRPRASTPTAPPATSRLDRFNLSPREREVVTLLARGQRIREIARALNIAENTVQQHVTNARRKLNAIDRLDAVLKAIGHGLIPFPPV